MHHCKSIPGHLPISGCPRKKVLIIESLAKARHLWLMPVTLATQEAEIRRITVQSQPGEIVYKILSRKKSVTKKGWWSGSRCRP
jgi:hypothetical protein